MSLLKKGFWRFI